MSSLKPKMTHQLHDRSDVGFGNDPRAIAGTKLMGEINQFRPSRMIYKSMNRDRWTDIVALLQHAGVYFVNGLTDAEVSDIETRFAFQFPPDLRALLQFALPSGSDFPNWRSGSESILREWLNLPRRGVLFDIEHHGFWLEEWGQKPSALSDRLQAADRLLTVAPRLIPVFAHRMMPEEPHLDGNPVSPFTRPTSSITAMTSKTTCATSSTFLIEEIGPSKSVKSDFGTLIVFKRCGGQTVLARLTIARLSAQKVQKPSS